MIKKLIGFSARHPLSILSALGGMVLLGISCAFIIPLDFLPPLKERFLIVSTEYPGVTAEEMRTLVTIPLEDAFAALGGLKSVSSVSREGLSLLRIELHWGTDTDLALAESREIIDICYEGLPSFCSKPKVSRESGSEKDSITIIMIPMDGDLRYGRYIAETDIKPRLQRLGAMVTVSGGEEEEIQVNFEKSGLESRGLNLSAAAEIIAAANFEYPGGTIREGELEYSVKTSGLYRNLEELKNTPLSWDQGSLLRVGDIAEVERKSGPQDSFFLYRSEERGIPHSVECIRIGLRKGPPPIPLSMKVKREIETLSALYSPWYRFEIAGDLSRQIIESLLALLFSSLAALLSAGLVVFIFLRSLKLSLVITGIIPLSALASVLSLAISGRSLNLMSLSGIAIGIGMVVDAGAVAVEQIDGELRKLHLKDGQEGDWPGPVIRGVSSVAMSSGASALSTVIVFIPVFFIPGLLGELFGDLAAAVIASISFSCLLSFTYIPAMGSLLRPEAQQETLRGRGLSRLSRTYRRSLFLLFRKPRLALIPLGICLAAGAVSLGLSKFTLLGELRGTTVSFELSFPPGTSLDKMRRTAQDLSRGLEEITEIRALEISGGLEKDDYPRLVNPSEIPEKIRFTGRLRGKAPLVRAKINGHFEKTPYTPVFSGNQDLLAQSLEIGEAENLLRSDSPGEAWERAEALLAELPPETGPGKTAQGVPGESPCGDFIPRIIRRDPAFIPDRLALARFSLSAQYIAQTARDTLEGIRESYYEGGREIPLVIKLRDEDLKSLEGLGETMVHLESTSIPLRLLGSLEEEQGEAVLYRHNRRDAKIFAFSLPEELEAKYLLLSPRGEETAEMLRGGLTLLAITIVLLYLSMGAQFESFLIPLVLLLAIPPSFAGAFFLLLITGLRPDINSLIALVVLFGISINNSILLYESCAALDGKTMDRRRRFFLIIKNCTEKLRAILITNVTTITALIPFAFDPLGLNSQASLSVALIGGLVFSLVLVLLLVPLCIGFAGGKR
ncbi:MAG: efflux RND transporter permease subunit [Treponema sp.]|jgi:multidrug efflux pump subunit AcrB|nr:efflux RND transporter permease subunit [Treponema sp.]